MVNYSNIFVNEGLTYHSYKELVTDRLARGMTTGTDHSAPMLHYSKMNLQRMKRVEKTVQLLPELQQALSALKSSYRLLIISEGWCGDAAQLVPVFQELALQFPDKLDLRLVLRDQHLELIDAHLTHGGRAIPLLLLINEKDEQIAQWGPRPVILQELLQQWKKDEADLFKLAEKLHLWYAKDHTVHTQNELSQLFGRLR